VRVEQVRLPARGDGLDTYRADSPNTRWTMPTGHYRDTSPPAALGAGSSTYDDDASRRMAALLAEDPPG
jgi:hypothetical protein